MGSSILILKLIGNVVLLLWGMRTVQNGVERAFGSDLRRVLGRALRNRLVAVAAGTGVTMLLQSSTATAMMVTSFAARGAVDLVPALAVMLGANLGTALIAKAMSFDVSLISPVLLLLGYGLFKRGPKGRPRDLGRVGIGLGLMLLSLHLMVETIEPIGTAPAIREVLSSLTADPVVDLLLAAALTFAAHSSVAIMLLLAGLSAGHAVTPFAAVALALGVNLGGALPPVLETGGTNPANRRVPVGNFLFRLLGCAIALPFVGPIARLVSHYDPNPGSAITSFHLAFNLVLAIACTGLLGPAQAILRKLLPEKAKEGPQATRPAFLDPDALSTPYLALANAAREILRMGELIQALIDLVANVLRRHDKSDAEDAMRLGRDLDLLHEAVKGYVARLERSEMTDSDMARMSDLVEFAVNLDHAGSVLERCVIRTSKAHGESMAPAACDVALGMHSRVARNVPLALSIMMTEDPRPARELLDAKRQINNIERVNARDHLAGLGSASSEDLGASTVYLAVLRDLRLVNSHIASIGYAILDTVDRRAA